MPPDRDALLAQLGTAFLAFLLHDFADPDSPPFLSGADCALRFAAALEAEFPRRVHAGLPISAATIADFDATADRRQSVDLVVADSEGAPLQHDVFVGVSHLPRGARGARVLAGIEADGRRLQNHLERAHCTAATLLVVDEGDLLDDGYAAVAHARGVPVMLASPKAVVRRAYAVQHDVDLPLWCPTCESPRLAAMRYGDEEAVVDESDQWINGGAAIWGEGRDARFGCRDCGFRGPRRRAHREPRRRPVVVPAPDAAA